MCLGSHAIAILIIFIYKEAHQFSVIIFFPVIKIITICLSLPLPFSENITMTKNELISVI